MQDVPTLEVDGARATIRFHRAERHNALGAADIATVVEHLASVDANANVRVLVLASTGRTFCAGYDLNALAGEQQGGAAAEAVTFGTMVDRLEHLRVPAVAALGGSLYGGGTDLALACDIRIGVPGIQLRMTASRIGVQYYASGMQRYVARVGLGAAKRIFLAAEALPAEELLRIGFLDELVPAGDLMKRVDELAHALATNAPGAVQGMKRSLNAIAAGTADAAAIDRAFAASLRSPDVTEGLAAYREKREPSF